MKRPKNTQINFKNNQTSLMFKIGAIRWARKGKIISFNWENYSKDFMCLRSISRSLELRKNIESNFKSHMIFYFYKNKLGIQNWVKIEPP